MSYIRKKRQDEIDIWPGFVDALSTVLLVFIFVLVGFIASQVYLSGIIFDKNSALSDTQVKLSTVCKLLNVEKDKNADLSRQITELNETVANLQSLFNKEEKLKNEEHNAKVSLEQSYRSEFFDKMKNIVKDKSGIKISGDRFIFQSELFFDSASDELSENGKKQVSELANIIKEIGTKIPKNIRWILRVDGHTDSRPINSGKFNSNWELSAARAISVVKYLIKKGVPQKHLVAAGFGENQPISSDLAKNRRIEFKLDEI